MAPYSTAAAAAIKSTGQRFATASAEAARHQGRARRAALSHAALATADLDRADVEAAATRAAHVVELAASVNSSRTLETVKDLQHRLKPYGTLPEVRHFTTRATELLGLAA
ncbi:hypothetical protein O7623_14855 [Solwaraspora sp. WMMD791]|uniref:hypothetical protein n=1 Tax=Solwaraspora sp. WMMD791 TaxID=3016086 RepID=UPI00249C148B|nr:hypothetical protein [Solwaraspora sp. WMMD791]WFE30381.1 hypothetical protein O7623_14855 [Solwaraspora sp. WMMD791]